MSIYIIVSNYFSSGVFGIYSSVKRAKIAFENFLANDEDIVAFEYIDNYSYRFTTKIGKTFVADIEFDVLDAEFEEGVCKKN